MAAVTPQMVKQLRDRTDQPMGLCKQALDQNGGDMEKAVDWLRAQNKSMGVKREGNETAEGRIGVYFDNAAKVAAIVEMRCESAPSAKSDQFVALANDLAKHVAAANPADAATAAGQTRPGLPPPPTPRRRPARPSPAARGPSRSGSTPWSASSARRWCCTSSS